MNDLYDEMLDDADNDDKKTGSENEQTYVGPVRHPVYKKQFNIEKCDLIESRIISAFAEFREDTPGSDAYQRDHNKLIDLLYRYVLDYDQYIYRKDRLGDIEDYGVEICEVSSECLAKCNREPKYFLKYFNTALNNKLKQAYGVNKYDSTHYGIKTPINPNDFKELNKFKPGYDNVISDPGPDRSNKSESNASCVTVDELVDSMSHDKLDKFLAFLNDHNYSIDDALFFWNGIDRSTITDDNGNETELYTIIPDSEHFEQAINVLDIIGQVYHNIRSEGKKKVDSMIITSLIICPIHKMPGILEVFKDQDYFDHDVYDHFMETGNVPNETWIADFLGKKLSHISREKSQFKKLISDACKRYN